MEHKQLLHKKMRSHRRTASENLDDLYFKADSRHPVPTHSKLPTLNDNQSKPKIIHERNYSSNYLMNADEHQVVKLLKVANEARSEKKTIVDYIDQQYDPNLKEDYSSPYPIRESYFMRDRFAEEPGILDFADFSSKQGKGCSNLNSERNKRFSRKNIFVRDNVQNPTINQYKQMQNFLKLRKTKVMNSNAFSEDKRLKGKVEN